MPRVTMCVLLDRLALPAPTDAVMAVACRSPPRGMCPCSKVNGGASMEEELDASFTVVDLKALISDSTDIPIEEMRVLHKGRAMHNEDTLEACGASRGSPPPSFTAAHPSRAGCASSQCSLANA